MKTKTLIAAALATSFCLSAPAMAKHGHKKADKLVQGTYTVSAGSVETFDISSSATTLEQLGSFDITLENTDWDSLPGSQKKNIKKTVHIKGKLKGTIDLTNLYTVGPVVSHVMVDDERSFVLRSANDVFFPQSGDLACSEGAPMQILEYVNIESATGEYSNLLGGSIALQGVVNNCPGMEDFGKYDLTIIPGESTLIFQ